MRRALRGRRPPGCLPAAGAMRGLRRRTARPHRAVRILHCPWWKRFQMRCIVRSVSWQSRARLAAKIPPETALWRNSHKALVVKLSRRILSASQTLKVRPQPGRAWRLLQKNRRARIVFRWGLLSSNPYKKAMPDPASRPTLQCGQDVCLIRSAIADHSLVIADKPSLPPPLGRCPRKVDQFLPGWGG